MSMKKNHVLLSLIVATAVSLIVNFAYLLSIWVVNDNNTASDEKPRPEITFEGVAHINADGYGYILTTAVDESALEEAESAEDTLRPSLVQHSFDSVYISSNRAHRLGVRDGMTITGTAEPARRPDARPVLMRIDTINGEEFDYSALFKRPDDNLLAAIQVGFYLLVAFLMCLIFTHNTQGNQRKHIDFFTRLGLCVVVAAVAFLLAPVVERYSGEIRLNIMSYNTFNPMVMLQCTFALVVCALYGLTWRMMVHQSAISVEMERLKGEALAARYDVLVGQINPHFLFNSLNSLSMLVREGNTEGALKYIDQLSYTFRYTIRPDGRNMVSLEEELKFLNAYRHLLEVRYADKLFFDIRIDEAMREWLMPALSLQPLVENAVKHNSITSARPLTISIYTEGNNLVISNPIVPKLTSEESTGIGLHNLTDRCSMLVGRRVEVSKDGGVFRVVLPLIHEAR